LPDTSTAAKQLGHSSSDITTEFYIRKNRTAPDVSHILQGLAAPQDRERKQ
jgi:hypothetical protein